MVLPSGLKTLIAKRPKDPSLVVGIAVMVLWGGFLFARVYDAPQDKPVASPVETTASVTPPSTPVVESATEGVSDSPRPDGDIYDTVMDTGGDVEYTESSGVQAAATFAPASSVEPSPSPSPAPPTQSPPTTTPAAQPQPETEPQPEPDIIGTALLCSIGICL